MIMIMMHLPFESRLTYPLHICKALTSANITSIAFCVGTVIFSVDFGVGKWDDDLIFVCKASFASPTPCYSIYI